MRAVVNRSVNRVEDHIFAQKDSEIELPSNGRLATRNGQPKRRRFWLVLPHLLIELSRLTNSTERVMKAMVKQRSVNRVEAHVFARKGDLFFAA